MKNSVTISFIVLCALLFTVSAFADSVVATKHFSGELDHGGAYGEWKVKEGRLLQNDEKERLAKINFEVPQEGTMQYRFDVRYEGGGVEDKMGGFGIHLFVDEACKRRSWGNGDSYLFWVNYDKDAEYGKPGFQAQVYRSYTNYKMRLLEDYQLEIPESYLGEADPDTIVPVKMELNGDTGTVKVWNPLREGVYYVFDLDSAPGKGDYISLRTNSLSVSFDNIVVEKKSK